MCVCVCVCYWQVSEDLIDASGPLRQEHCGSSSLIGGFHSGLSALTGDILARFHRYGDKRQPRLNTHTHTHTHKAESLVFEWGPWFWHLDTRCSKTTIQQFKNKVCRHKTAGIYRFHHLQSIISLKDSENPEKSLHVRNKAENQH